MSIEENNSGENMKKYINQQDMKDANVYNVLRLIRKEERLTRRNIEEKTGLSWGAVSKVTSILLERKYIHEVSVKENTGPGRTPVYLEINPSEYFTVGLDVNKSGLFGVLINMKNEVRYTVSKKIKVFEKESLLEEISCVIEQILKVSEGHEILGIGVAMQGLVDSAAGISVRFPACKLWENVKLKKYLEEKFNIPTFLEHDPECILYAHSGNEEIKDCILIRVDNGIGMAVMIDGRIFKRLGAFELGNMKPCGEKKLGVFASADGIEEVWGKKVSELAKMPDDKKCEVFDTLGKMLGISIYNVTELLNVHNVLLCGEMFEYKDRFFDKMKEWAGERAVFFEADVKNAAIGAGMIATDLSEFSFS